MTEHDDTTRAAARAASGTTQVAAGLMERLADRLGGKASVAAVFGDPIASDGVTVVPVAKVRFGFGSGAGLDSGPGKPGEAGRGGRSSEGARGGGGVEAKPLGFIEIKDGAAAYRPVREPWSEAVIPLAAIAAVLALRIVRSLVRQRRR